MNSKITTISALLFTCLALLSTPASGRTLTFLGDRNPGPKPSVLLNGSYRPVLNSLRSGYVQSINLDSVISYAKPTVVSFEGKSYWEIVVTYRRHGHGSGANICEARALVRDGQVQVWAMPNSTTRVR